MLLREITHCLSINISSDLLSIPENGPDNIKSIYKEEVYLDYEVCVILVYQGLYNDKIQIEQIKYLLSQSFHFSLYSHKTSEQCGLGLSFQILKLIEIVPCAPVSYARRLLQYLTYSIRHVIVSRMILFNNYSITLHFNAFCNIIIFKASKHILGISL